MLLVFFLLFFSFLSIFSIQLHICSSIIEVYLRLQAIDPVVLLRHGVEFEVIISLGFEKIPR
jgi:hypothetical protein